MTILTLEGDEQTTQTSPAVEASSGNARAAVARSNRHIQLQLPAGVRRGHGPR